MAAVSPSSLEFPSTQGSLSPRFIFASTRSSLDLRLCLSALSSSVWVRSSVTSPAPAPAPFQPAGLPSLPHINTAPIPHYVPNAHPMPYTPVSYTSGLQYAKQFQSAPELSILASLPPLKPNPVQVPKPRFVATKRGVQPGVWRPGAF